MRRIYMQHMAKITYTTYMLSSIDNYLFHNVVTSVNYS